MGSTVDVLLDAAARLSWDIDTCRSTARIPHAREGGSGPTGRAARGRGQRVNRQRRGPVRLGPGPGGPAAPGGPGRRRAQHRAAGGRHGPAGVRRRRPLMLNAGQVAQMATSGARLQLAIAPGRRRQDHSEARIGRRMDRGRWERGKIGSGSGDRVASTCTEVSGGLVRYGVNRPLIGPVGPSTRSFWSRALKPTAKSPLTTPMLAPFSETCQRPM
jgi:hypothetical protein